ncbi:putative ubx domain-containing protein [Phaeoacremonium minimum UCRPA7]|uniref:UBX domain-containing protein 2 n=1 Tax=Phaeoacremonium minimum (strain UCR-PA7) TaxID=1286976 RepID=R8BQF7_PHAM7|nr:putative ubx domain-containing protein [Phaeoacremonium minimum UCRPA7]EOO01613.1 putative ubx domain-containing protein [Phaeoacremonium minimum UCRPA7]
MFFTGTLQEGISTAVQQGKLVVCFVTDNNEESQKWENEYLKEDAVSSALAKEGVTLRLEAGSQEASYLAAIFPLPKTPTLVIIKNGELKEYIAAGVSREDFMARVSKVLQITQEIPAASAASTSAQTPAAQAPPADVSDVGESSSGVEGTDTPTSIAEEQQAEAERVARLAAQQRNLALEGERRRQAAEKARKEADEAERQRKAKGKQPAIETDEGESKKKQPSDAVNKASQHYMDKQRQVREERQRVLKMIEDDKAARKARELERRAERDADRAAMGSLHEGVQTAAPASSLRPGRKSDRCSLQVRLFDGSTIRTQMPANNSLRGDVRKWVDETRQDGRDPYTFKVVLTPLPNRAIDATEEEKSLEDLDLTPSATLILVPVDKFSVAYAEANSNPVMRLFAPIIAFFSWIVNLFTTFFSTLFSTAGPPEPTTGNQAPQQDDAPRGGRRIQGFQNPNDRQRDQQLYNGNSLNFEPRKDDDDDQQ